MALNLEQALARLTSIGTEDITAAKVALQEIIGEGSRDTHSRAQFVELFVDPSRFHYSLQD